MENTKGGRQGNNVYQARLYTIGNHLVYKRSYVDAKEAECSILRYMENKQEGYLYSRGIIRCLDPISKDWVIYRSMPNPNGCLFDPIGDHAEEWELSLYGIGDQCIEVARFQKKPKETHLKICMIALGAVYMVLAARERAAEKNQFLVSKIIHNQYFNLHVFNLENVQRPVASTRELLETYYSAFVQDREETEQILRSQSWEDIRASMEPFE